MKQALSARLFHWRNSSNLCMRSKRYIRNPTEHWFSCFSSLGDEYVLTIRHFVHLLFFASASVAELGMSANVTANFLSSGSSRSDCSVSVAGLNPGPGGAPCFATNLFNVFS